uniref:3-hydroxyisobutyrate dehydrogenase, mitochondrial n=1 Tax=Laticauda laticaudata TaxID=8630 RepID=A0A8C5S1K7_LATLA
MAKCCGPAVGQFPFPSSPPGSHSHAASPHVSEASVGCGQVGPVSRFGEQVPKRPRNAGRNCSKCEVLENQHWLLLHPPLLPLPSQARPGMGREGEGVGAARAGNLTFMVGGVEQEFDAAKELLTCMGSNVVYCGEVGTGQAAKICNNMLLAISMIGTAETMNLGIRLGLDPKLLAKILNMSSGRCWSSDTYNPVPGVMEGVPSANNYQGGFGTTLMAKDLGLAQISATNTKSPVPLGSLAHQIYRIMCAKGYAQKDFSSVFQFLREEENL